MHVFYRLTMATAAKTATIRNAGAAVIALCLTTFLLFGCGHTSDILDSIPADAAVVITLSPDQLDTDLDGQRYGGTLTSGQTIEKYLKHAEPEVRTVVKTILSTQAIDRSLVVIYSHQDTDGVNFISMISDGVYIVTFTVADEQRLVQELQIDSPEDIDGFKAYKLTRSSSLIIKGTQGWLVSGKPQKAVNTISRHLDIACGKSIKSVKEANEFLNKDGYLFNMLISLRSTDVPGWTHIYGTLADDGRKLKFKASFYDLNGKKTDLDDNLEQIDSELLKYIAPSDVFVAGLGLSDDTDWESITGYMTNLFPMNISQRAMLAVIVPYLKRIDGTILIAAGPAQEEPDLDSAGPQARQLNFFVGIELKKNQVKATLDEFSNLITTLGLPVTKLDGDRFVWSVPGMPPITMQVVDGNCIALTNRPLEQLGNKAADKILDGNSFAVWSNIPSKLAHDTYGGLGFKLNLEMDDDLDISFRFNGSDRPILEQVALSISPDNEQDASPKRRR